MKHDQHFMIDLPLIDRIISYGDISSLDTVLEIGAGNGVLTTALCTKAKKVIAIEIDKELVKDLPKKRNLQVIQGNALKVLKKENLSFNKVVSNIPYSISEPLFNFLLRLDFEIAVLTVSKSFSDKVRLVKPSKVGLIAHLFFDVEEKEVVPRTSFEPMPKIDSAIIIIRPKEEYTIFEKILGEFIYRDRQKVKNALREAITLNTEYTKRDVKSLIDETLIPTVYNKLVRNLSYNELKRLIFNLYNSDMFKDIIRNQKRFW